ncbi:MAG: polyhydroxyalkanoic acid system family protein [Planctomycetes bacterium]|nr:polyhydroxyalkanoic acid system family protein [Planctomycetota bacterium]
MSFKMKLVWPEAAARTQDATRLASKHGVKLIFEGNHGSFTGPGASGNICIDGSTVHVAVRTSWFVPDFAVRNRLQTLLEAEGATLAS